MSTLGALWSRLERGWLAKTALVDGENRLTYGQTGEAIRRLMAGLILRWRLHAGAVVAVLAPNCAEFVVSYFAVTSAGAAVQPIDERLTPEEIKAALLDSRARFLIVHQKLASKFERIRGELPEMEGLLGIGYAPAAGDEFGRWLSEPLQDVPAPAFGPNTVAELMYTSGTSGEPKGVMRSHANVLAAARNSVTAFGYRDGDVMAIVMPLSHSSALNSQLIPILKSGGTAVLLNGFDNRQLLSVIASERITCLRTVPTMMRMLLASPGFCSEALPSLRLLINSSAAIDAETYRAVKSRFPAVSLMNSYGLTEASTCTILPDSSALTDPDSVGYPIEGVEMCVRDENGKETDRGAIGEIHVRGDHVFVGYLNRPEATRSALVDGWLKTGDLGYRDERGLYFICGRKTDLINCGGRKFAPAEVESCLLQLPQVLEAAVIGVPHRMLGEVAKAFVVVSSGDGVDAKRVINHCARRLPSHKVPFSVVFVSELPKNSTGKLQHRKLREI